MAYPHNTGHGKEMEKILITGGAGFIGSNFIRYFLNKHKDYHIINFDKLSYAGNMENLKDLEADNRYRFIKGDICETAAVDKVVKEADHIINFAAESHVDRSIDAPFDFFHANVRGTQNLLESARKYDIKRIIQLSTDEVYGSVSKGFSKEGDSLEPNSPYSASKAVADILSQSYQRTYSLPVMIVRPSNNFGQYQFPEKIIPLFITNALEEKALPLYADGMNVRDWIYVLDNCEAIDTVFHKGEEGEIYNIGGGNHLTNLDITHFMLEILNKPRDLIRFVKDRPGHDKRYALNSDKLKGLGWKPRHRFRDALEKTIQWYKNNSQWWRKVKKS